MFAKQLCKSAPHVKNIIHLFLYLTGVMSSISLKTHGTIAVFLSNICQRNNQFQAKTIIELR